ncbi:PhzF family phenazine biosynthesis protein [Sinanaerobacter chloroacetimidivorans]|uniref:PhzF family phenazine biosynthesis protein n=1 Tax=Sinanaerobacter chloroacetimidivorans TaxID=2818044 RepID=A0A8J7W4Y4_9FIRM|nr:PhzF family phenazine biosynthesis protein [Sinanaerobacter chloroacetimidivorans]MBR0599178.1 PhzF family phenazine biosynthesis protein [Sinanaerobacter chloroacetimidivorans]
MKFYIVDAFTDVLFGGNPAGIVILEESAKFPEDELMRKTAEELRYSETAFILRISEKEFQVRYFTPAAEVDLCGHATIGAFTALLADGQIKDRDSYFCHTKAGVLNIDIKDRFVMMDMGAPVSLGKIESEEELNELYSIMGIPYADAAKITYSGELHSSSRLFPELISTGLPDIMMPLSSQEMLSRLSPDFDALSKLSEKYQVVGVHAFAMGEEEITAHCRNFAPLYGINEEAATGTSNGALTYYLYKNGMIKENAFNTFIQGEAMNRPSQILSRLAVQKDSSFEEKESTVKIQVGGTGTVLAGGTIYIG